MMMKATRQRTRTTVLAVPGNARLLVLAVALAVGASAALRGQTLELQLVPSNAVPRTATFYSVQLTNSAPLPWNPFPLLDVYTFADTPGWYWVDDRAVDYAALREQREAERALRRLESQYGMESSSELPPTPDTWQGSGEEEENWPESDEPPVYVSGRGLCLWPPVIQGTNVALTVTNGSAGARYDLYATTNLSPNVPGMNLTNWLWLGRLDPNQTVVWVPRFSDQQCWYRLGTTNDLDGDGLPDAYENLVAHTSPEAYGGLWSDGYWTADGWYLEWGLNPLSPGIATQDADQDGLLNWEEYRYGSSPQGAEGFGVWVSSPHGFSGLP